MPLSMGISTVLHTAGPFLLVALVLLLALLLQWLFQFDLWSLLPREEKKPDIEFVIVQDRKAPKPKDARFKGEFNQQAGGKPKPTERVAPVEKPLQAQKQPTPPQKPAPQQPPPRPVAQAVPQQAPTPKQPPAPPARQPQAVKPAPAFKPTLPLPVAPGPKTPATQDGRQSGPIASATAGRQGAPGPMTIASTAGASSGSGSATGTIGSPEAGNGPDGVSVEASADFGPYMAELKRRMQRNWRPPRGEKTKRVVIEFKIARDGRLVNMAVNQTSGDPFSDEAAINAVKLSAPFRPLPPGFKGDQVPILFTFDYTVYGAGKKN